MTLNIFTHPVKKPTIKESISSWRDTFGMEGSLKMWKDGMNTTGLADGYIKSVQECTDDYIFMLEHDWEFVGSIDHDLEEIVSLMRNSGITHLRFNKRANDPKVYDKWLKDRGWYCETPFVSNNPHIIDRKAYLGYIEKGYIQRLGKDKGVEEIISKHINGAIYGGLGFPAVVRHLNAR